MMHTPNPPSDEHAIASHQSALAVMRPIWDSINAEFAARRRVALDAYHARQEAALALAEDAAYDALYASDDATASLPEGVFVRDMLP